MNPLQFLKRSPARVLLAAALVSSAVITTITPAGSLPISGAVIAGFEIDGDQLAPGADLDWEAVAADVDTVDDVAFGTSGFTGDSFELSPSAWECTTEGGNPNRTNILRGYVNQRVTADNEFVVDLGVVRNNVEDLGDLFDEYILGGDDHETAVMAEISQNAPETPADFTGGPVDCSHDRDAGDLLIDWRYDDINNGFVNTAEAFRWDATDPDGAGELEGNWITDNLVSTDARGETSPTFDEITDVLFGDAEIGGRKFSEATVNLTQALDLGPEDCSFDGFVQFRSRNNNGFFEDDADQANLEDWLAPVPVDFNVCATIRVTKNTVPEQDVDFNFVGSGSIGPFTLNDTNGPERTDSFDVFPGDYTITETPVPGFDLTDIDCIPANGATVNSTDEVTGVADLTVTALSQVECFYTNVERATVTIIKDTVPDSEQDFVFHATGPGGFSQDATLDDDGNNANALSNTVTESVVPNPVGDPYIVVEESVPGYELVDVTCLLNGVLLPLADIQVLDGDDLVGIGGNLNPGDDLVCTFSNVLLATVTIVKDTVPNTDQDFTFNATGPFGFAASATLDDDGINGNPLSNSITTQVLPNDALGLDPYVLTEVPVDGYILETVNCSLNGVALPLADIQVLDGDDLVGVGGQVSSGDDLVCTFVNDLQAGNATITVEGGDPTFVIAPDPQGASPFELDEDESQTFVNLPVGVYTVTTIDIEDDLVLDGIDCDPEEISTEFVGDPSVTFAVVDDGAITCTFTVSEEDDGYDQYPGDDDFDFDTPFDDADDDDPAPVVEVAGENNNNAQPPAEQPVAPVVLPETAVPAPDAAPAALDTLPRTGSGASNMTILAGLFLTLGGLALVAGRRRKATSQA